jgi:predicted nucleic acid-binding protein
VTATVLLDSNILIDAGKGLPQAFHELSRYRRHAISRINWIEVLSVRDAAQAQVLSGLANSFEMIEVSIEIATRTVDIRRTTRLKLADAMIYATALEHGLTLITRNTKDFNEQMPSVRIPYTV